MTFRYSYFMRFKRSRYSVSKLKGRKSEGLFTGHWSMMHFWRRSACIIPLLQRRNNQSEYPRNACRKWKRKHRGYLIKVFWRQMFMFCSQCYVYNPQKLATRQVSALNTKCAAKQGFEMSMSTFTVSGLEENQQLAKKEIV